jgi:hypothetical protein
MCIEVSKEKKKEEFGARLACPFKYMGAWDPSISAPYT